MNSVKHITPRQPDTPHGGGELKVFFCCTGVGIFNRGIESFFREAFDGLRDTPGLSITLYKGAGPESEGERTLWNFPRTGETARTLGKLIKRDGYVVEQLSSFAPLVRQIRKHKPDIIFYSEGNLGLQLHRWRRWIGVPFQLLFSNGGPCTPPFFGVDYVHQVAPHYLEVALAAGVHDEVQSMVPYGISVPNGGPEYDPGKKIQMRQKLGLPAREKIVLSVGWISARHKRMDYVIREIAALPEPRPHLVMIGNMDSESEPILKLAAEALGAGGFTARSVPYAEVSGYYQAADIFVLGSLREGFGRVYLEALIHGLPCIVNDHSVMRYVLDTEAVYRDLAEPGAAASAIQELLSQAPCAEAMARRRESVRRRFSWPALAPAYRDMFFRCHAAAGKHHVRPGAAA